LTVLLDSWAWIEFLKDGPRANSVAPYLESPGDLIISTMNVAEIYLFLLRHAKPDLITFITERCNIVSVTEIVALNAATLKHQHKMGLADAIIYATAQEHGATLVTGDPDFKGKKGVIYIGP
jgi:predicted nucleic acid-binding protein